MRGRSDYTVVVVDDDFANLAYIRRLLTRQGYDRLHLFDNGEELLDRYDALAADVVLLDLHMPQCDGLDVLRELKSQRFSSSFVPVVVITSDSAAETRQRALTLGAADYLTRPFDREELLLRMQNLLQQRDLHSQIVASNRVLEHQIQLSETERSRTQAEVLVRLARAAEYRDDQTGTHTWRVGYTARLIAQELSASTRFVDLIGLAARLHDVGKIGIPDRVLLKPGPLSPDEYMMMKAHTTIGASLLSGGNSPLMMMAEAIALTHHEAWDGSGYPLGTSAEHIPREGRIVAVADVFDALTHLRAYKRSWSDTAAITEIENGRGSKFDPDVVDAFLRVYRNGALGDVVVPCDEDDEIARAAIAAALFAGDTLCC